MPPLLLVRAFLEKATGLNTRSTVLKSLAWLILILISATIASFTYKLPEWIGISFFAMTGCSVLLYLFAYTFCLFKDRDSLRSETYIIHKMAIEKGCIGDSMTGLFEPPSDPGRMLPSGSTSEEVRR